MRVRISSELKLKYSMQVLYLVELGTKQIELAYHGKFPLFGVLAQDLSSTSLHAGICYINGRLCFENLGYSLSGSFCPCSARWAFIEISQVELVDRECIRRALNRAFEVDFSLECQLPSVYDSLERNYMLGRRIKCITGN